MGEHVAKAMVKPGAPVTHKGFQSAAALEASIPKTEEEDPNAEPKSALVADELGVPDEVDLEDVAASTKLTKIRSRQAIQAFRYGTQTYAIPANKDVLVPLCVKRHLEEKGLL